MLQILAQTSLPRGGLPAPSDLLVPRVPRSVLLHPAQPPGWRLLSQGYALLEGKELPSRRALATGTGTVPHRGPAIAVEWGMERARRWKRGALFQKAGAWETQGGQLSRSAHALRSPSAPKEAGRPCPRLCRGSPRRAQGLSVQRRPGREEDLRGLESEQQNPSLRNTNRCDLVRHGQRLGPSAPSACLTAVNTPARPRAARSAPAPPLSAHLQPIRSRAARASRPCTPPSARGTDGSLCAWASRRSLPSPQRFCWSRFWAERCSPGPEVAFLGLCRLKNWTQLIPESQPTPFLTTYQYSHLKQGVTLWPGVRLWSGSLSCQGQDLIWLHNRPWSVCDQESDWRVWDQFCLPTQTFPPPIYILMKIFGSNFREYSQFSTQFKFNSFLLTLFCFVLFPFWDI